MKTLKEKYHIKTTEIKTGENTWSKLKVEIWQHELLIGEYERGYHNLYHTFFPFIKNGKEYALYSPNYMETSVMSLPDCKHIATTKSGFCPVDFFVPNFESFMEDKDTYEVLLKKAREENNEKHIEIYINDIKHWEKDAKLVGTRGLVSGCVWGDDSGGWKVNMIDLSEIENGKIELTDELGYFQLPALSLSLEQMVDWDEPDMMNIALGATYKFSDKKEESGFLGYGIANLKMYSGKWHDNFEVTKVVNGEVNNIW